jgi:diaminopimelate decarboxylase
VQRLRHQRPALLAARGAAGTGCAGDHTAAARARTVVAGAAKQSGRSGEEAGERHFAVSAFRYVDGELHVENVPLSAVAAEFGTPCYVYSRAALEGAYREYDESFAGVDHLVCYALKANSNLAILGLFARLGSGFDIVSGGELARVLAAGGDPRKIVFSGVGKTEREMRDALDAGILCFNVESEAELARLDTVAAAAGKRAPISFRVNPDVDPRTHPYIATGLKDSKFGVAFDDARDLYRRAANMPNVAVHGIDMHIGSQITELEPYREAVVKVLDLVDTLRGDGIALSHVDLGGGLGIRYRDEHPVRLSEYAEMVRSLFEGRDERLLFEPGRRLVGAAGVLLTKVEFLKPGETRSFAIVDAAMNDLLRPALYDAWHPVDAVRPRAGHVQEWEIVGPVCESGDFLAHGRRLALAPGDLLAIGAAGAYGHVMSSNYNSRPRACEVIVDDSRTHLARRREEVADLMRHESLLP